jgi:hypothetical protein
MGNTREAKKLLDEVRSDPLRTYDVAYIYLGLGQKDQALEWLEKTYQARFPWLAFQIKVDPRLNSLRSDRGSRTSCGAWRPAVSTKPDPQCFSGGALSRRSIF